MIKINQPNTKKILTMFLIQCCTWNPDPATVSVFKSVNDDCIKLNIFLVNKNFIKNIKIKTNKLINQGGMLSEYLLVAHGGGAGMGVIFLSAVN